MNAVLLLSICQVETKLKNINNPHDHNGGSYGVAQIQLPTARDVSPETDLLALQMPSHNIKVAALIFKRLMKRYKDPWKAVAVYNAGSLRYSDGKLINQKYVNAVWEQYRQYKKKLCLYRGYHDTHSVQKERQYADVH